MTGEQDWTTACQALFPDLNPFPVIETDESGNITYCNPTARRRFPDLESGASTHPLVQNIRATVERYRRDGTTSLVHEIRLGERVYEQYVAYIKARRTTHSYVFEITQRKQAEALDRILGQIHQPLDYALYMESTLPVIIQRLGGRRVCRDCGALFHIRNRPPKKENICDQCGGGLYQRADDNEATIRTRMDVYLKNTRPVIDYYKAQGKLKKVDADKDSTEVQTILMQIFHEDHKLNQH